MAEYDGSGWFSDRFVDSIESTWQMAKVIGDSDIGSSIESLTSVWQLQTPDMFLFRPILADVPQTIPIDISEATLETGEPNPLNATKTAWFEIDRTNLSIPIRFTVSGDTSTGRVAVFRRNSAYATGDPTFANITLISSGSDVTIAPDEQYTSLFVQLSAQTGTGEDLVLNIEDATPRAGAFWDSPIWIDGTSGYETVDTANSGVEAGEPIPAGVTAAGTSWFAWQAPDPGPESINFSVLPNLGVGDVGLAVYTGGAVNALTLVTSATGLATGGAKVSFAPTPGTVYYLQVSVEDERRVWEMTWALPAVPVPPAEMYAYLRAEAYTRTNVFITEIPRRKGVQFTEPLNEVGAGSLEVVMSDPILDQYPGLLDEGNFIKFWLGDKCVHGFRIKDTDETLISDGEHTNRWIKVSGPSVQELLDDFVLHHDEEPRPDSPDERAFSWASRPGEWYDAEQWDDQMNADSQKDPPGAQGRPAKQRPKYGMPKKWPDPNSLWLWVAQDRKRNENNWKPKRPIKGLKYYRRNFKIDADGTRVRMFLTSDESAKLYIDGDLIMSKSSRETGYESFVKSSLTLSRGMHTVAIFVGPSRPRRGHGSDGVDAMMFSMFGVTDEGKRGDVIVRSNRRWKAWFGEGVPGWNRAQVFREAWKEAKDRQNDTAKRLKMGFTGDVDSAGKAWADSFNQSIRIGTSSLELQTMLSESGRFDVWVDPNTLTVHAWKRRGEDRSASVALIPGVNLLDWSSKTIDQIKNDFLIRFDGGFTAVSAPGSVEKHGAREAYIELGGIKDGGTARTLMKRVIRGVESAIRRAGAPDVTVRRETTRTPGAIIGVHGAYPFLDFGVGDIISAPGGGNKMVPMRVLSLACTEDDNGMLAFDPELEAVGV